MVAAYDTILVALELARPAPRAPIPAHLIGNLFSTSTYDPPMGRVESLIASGNIGLVRSAELRERIAGWPSQVRESREHQTRTRDFRMDDFAPSLRGLTDMAPLWAANRDTTVRQVELPTSVSMTNLVHQLQFHANINGWADRQLRKELIALQALVQAELGRNSAVPAGAR